MVNIDEGTGDDQHGLACMYVPTGVPAYTCHLSDTFFKVADIILAISLLEYFSQLRLPTHVIHILQF